MCKVCATDNGRRPQKKKRMGATLTFLECYNRDGDKFLDHIVTGDETWVSHFTPESKHQASFWLSSCREAQPSTPNRIVKL
jgi:hypothetical protein